MSRESSADIVRLEAAQAAIRAAFLSWQCRLRQRAIRNGEGRPSSGMRPLMTLGENDQLGPVTVLIVPREPAETTAEFRYLVKQTHDPAERYSAALKLLAAHHYQHPERFSDRMTALFSAESDVATAALRSGRCRLDFDQYSQRYRLPCGVSELAEQDPAYQATFWHNSLFNPRIPIGIRVIAFQPHWARAEADPPVR